MIGFAVLSILIAVFANDKNIFFLLLLLCAIRNLDLKKLIEINWKIFSISFFIVVFLALMKIIPDWTYQTIGKENVRHSIGFYYSTIAMGIFLSIILMRFYIKKCNCSYAELIVLEVINILLYCYTGGKLGFILGTITLITMLLSKKKVLKQLLHKEILQKIIRIMCYALPILIFIIVIITSCFYDYSNNIYTSIDKIFTGRIRLTHNAFQTYDITLFGQEIEWYGLGGHGYIDLEETEKFIYNYVDTSYAKIILDYGVILGIGVLIAYTVTLVKSYNKKDYWTILAIFFVLIWAIIEPYIVNVSRNIFVIIVFVPLLEYGEIKGLNYKKSKGECDIN